MEAEPVSEADRLYGRFRDIREDSSSLAIVIALLLRMTDRCRLVVDRSFTGECWE